MVRRNRHSSIYGKQVSYSDTWFGRFRALPLWKKLLIIGLLGFLVLVLIALVTYLIFAGDISNKDRLMNRNNTGVTLLDMNGTEFFSSSNKSTTEVKLADMSEWASKSLLSSEDKNFYTHGAVSFKSLLGAVYGNIVAGDATAYGGSTITQQLVKNMLLTSNKNILRKYQEVVMAYAVEQHYSKDDILEMYLNSVYFGEGAFGIEDAAKTYFGKSAHDLTLSEAAMLIGILPAPSAYSPISGDPAKAKVQQQRVLRRLFEDGKITSDQRAAADAAELTYSSTAASSSAARAAPHFANMVIDELYNKYGEETVKRSGYKVTTTLDLDWQKKTESIVAAQVPLNAKGGGRNASVVAIDPQTGQVRVLVGSADYTNKDFGQVNMAVTARQPGSSFKPIYETEALNEKLVTPATILRDEATDFDGYKPNNYDFQFRGDISMRNALAQSLNIPAVKIMQKLGVDKAVAKARAMGLTTVSADKDYGLSLALGSAEVTPLAMTNAYAAFASQGLQHKTSIIDHIDSKYGGRVFSASKSTSVRVQSVEATYLISDILSDNTARAPSFGTRLNIAGHKVAVKTGSTDDNRDAWTLGYTPKIAVGVWVGNNENEVMTVGGSGMAGPIWTKAIAAFLGGDTSWYEQPSSIVKASACTASGSTYQELFIKGTQPSNNCSKPTTDTPQNATVDVCPNIAGSQASLPTGYIFDSSDNCVKQADQPVDVCPNLAGNQTQPPAGYIVDSVTGKCVKQTSNDLCPNIAGTQTSMSGYTLDANGNCVASSGTGTTTQTDSDGDGVSDSVDVCPNVPAGATPDPNRPGCPLPASGGTTPQPTSN